MKAVTRRTFLGGAAATAAGIAAGPWVLRAHAQSGPLKIGLVLPYTGATRCSARASPRAWSWSSPGRTGRWPGRKIEMIKEDDEMKPPVGIRKTEKLIDSDKVDILTGPVHSGILMGMRDKVHASKTILIVSNAGADAISRATLLEVDLPHLLLELAAQPAHGRRGWRRTCRRKSSMIAPNYQAGKDQMERLQGDLPPRRAARSSARTIRSSARPTMRRTSRRSSSRAPRPSTPSSPARTP